MARDARPPTTFVWEQPGWPKFSWDASALLGPLGRVRRRQGQLLAHADAVGLMAQADLFAEEALTTSAIEGQTLSPRSVRSSVAARLGLPTGGVSPVDRSVEGLVDMLVDATTAWSTPLTVTRLKGWQAGLFPSAHSGIHAIAVGRWRPGKHPMRIVSGPIGKEVVHFEAPPAKRVPDEVRRFLRWWRSSPPGLDGLLRAAIAHFWFVTIHPFEDGNGRVARAITDMALAQDEQTGRRLYSMSARIHAERRDYYDVLARTQRGAGELTEWLGWFLERLDRAFERSSSLIGDTRARTRFWELHAMTSMNARQRKVITRLLDAGRDGFEGGLTTRKYVSLTRTSPATAKREIADLVLNEVLAMNPSRGRSTNYSLRWPE